jgi:predicted transcriptional regulator
MGVTKSDFFSTEQNNSALLFKALGHPARIAIIEYIMKKNSCICNDLVGELPLSQATISQHLKELKDADIIQGAIEGNSICYCLNINTMDKLIETMVSMREKISNKKNECC